jgi:dolichol-phosphate mannosyltransferase
MKLSLVIPAHNEEGCIKDTLLKLSATLNLKAIPHELLVINDNSQDQTEAILIQLQKELPVLRYINNPPPNGFGLAVRKGLGNFDGDVVAVVMADGSDLPEDVVKFYETIQKGYDCVFGTRFKGNAKVVAYPKFKLILNRIVNFGIRMLFRLKYNDITNAFKMYRAEVIPGLKPFLSHHFNLTVELPLKAIIRGYSYTVVPNSWLNRCAGESKLKIKEMGSRYLFIILYCFIEKWLSRGDYITNGVNIKQNVSISANGKRTI